MYHFDLPKAVDYYIYMSIHYINYKVGYKTLLDLITLILMISLALCLLPIGLVWGAKVLLQQK